ncbi:DUF2147 domain-containing protein [Marinoscillum sp. MHG1-6]|uniref:DUF2147 domain-containing protein n=1 Tax=Marinoscillum sp. MHG1-6 TaxID=2959627 RepID=UPI0021589B5A|nr:DUF2147 domain-containing protein [Marinoscillum sp. MHG1-6]
MKTIFTAIAILFMLSTNAQTIIGKWKMVGMKSGKERSLIDIYEKDGKYFGKVIETYPTNGDDPNPLCTECDDYRKDQPVVGMDIITDLEYNGRSGEYKGGEILDPTSGNVYNCKAWLGKDGFLRIRGYLMFFSLGKTYVLPKYVGDSN